MTLFDYFDRTSIIHLPEREDRWRALERELRPLGIGLQDSKVRVPNAPKPEDANGYRSRGVYGNFLSHYNILREALEDGLETVWILEDDAIFSRRLIREQERIAEFLATTDWGICHLGHRLGRALNGMPEGLIPFSGPFVWAHCYAVHQRALARVVAYLEETMVNPPGHPRGGKVYIDAAYTLFRAFNPDIVSLVANPVLSIQKGCVSSLGGGYWYDHNWITRPMVDLARSIRDECWRRTGLNLSRFG